MKFGETLLTHLTPEWRKQYIAYDVLKQMIYKTVRLQRQESYFKTFEAEFFAACEQELLKINTFFAEKLAEAKRKFGELNAEVLYLARPYRRKSSSKIDLSSYLPKRTGKQLKFALSEYYLSLILLQNYQTLNHTGFRKILKKHDKNLHVEDGTKWFKSNVDRAEFVINREITKLIEDTERTYTNYLEGGDRSRAMKRLRVPPFGEEQSPWRTFRLGLALGAFVCLCGFIIITVYSLPLPKVHLMYCFQLYRGPFLIILFLFLIGINIYGWQTAGVNHILIFEIDPRNHLTSTHLMEIAACFAVLWATCILCFLHRKPEFVPPYAFPLIIQLGLIIYWISPLPIHRNARYWLLKLVGRVVCAPVFPVGFADFWLADQLNSLAVMLMDYEYSFCFYCANRNWYSPSDLSLCSGYLHEVVQAIIMCLPAWWRFAQSLRRFRDTRLAFPFLVNAFKYASTFPVAAFSVSMVKYQSEYKLPEDNPHFWCFIVSRIVSTTYCYLWDIFMDFGLFKKFTCENMFLREQIIYAKFVYYAVIVEDFVLRWFWVVIVILNLNKILGKFELTTIGACLEVIRRYIWNYIRLENEHLNNAGRFRAVRDISIELLPAINRKSVESKNVNVNQMSSIDSNDDDDD